MIEDDLDYKEKTGSHNEDAEGNLDEEGSSLNYNEEEELISDQDENIEDDEVTSTQMKKEEQSEKDEKREKTEVDKNLIEIEMHDSEGEVEKEYELLFCVQGIGKQTNGKAYEKHQFCEPSLRDIHRFLRNDDSENPQMKYLILSWKTAETDIIPLMLNYENSEKIQQLGLVLLTDLTEPLSDLVEKRPVFERLYTELQEFIVKSQLIELLSNTLADATRKLREANIMRNDLKLIENETDIGSRKINSLDSEKLDINEEEQKKKKNEIKKRIAEIESKSEQLIELIFVFFKQLLNIYFSDSIEKNIENTLHLVKKFSKCRIFDAMIYHSQDYNTEFSKRIAPVLLELIYLLLRPFNPLKIYEFYRNNKSKYDNFHSNNIININSAENFMKAKSEINCKTELAIIRENEKKEKMLRFNQQSHRPNNFGTTIKINRPLDNSTIVISNFNQFIQNPEKIINEKMNTVTNQRRKPIRKLVPKVKMNAVKISEEIKLINDYKISENLLIDFSHEDIIFPIKNFIEEYIKYCFNNTIKYFISEIISLNDAFEKYDFYNLINLISFCLNYERLRLHDLVSLEKNKDAISYVKADKNKYNAIFNLKNVLEGISPGVMDFIYNIFFNESIKGNKDNRKLFEFYASARYIQILLLICLDLHKFKTDENIDLNVMIQDYILTRDFRKPIKAMFILYKENHYPLGILYTCIQLTDIYFTCLELISQKRKLKIKTKKVLKLRKDSEDEEKLVEKIKNEDQGSNFIIKQENSDLESDKKNETIDSEEEKYEIIERDLNLLNEIEQLLDYSIISKIMRLFNLNLISNKNFSNDNIKEIENLKKENISKYIFNIFQRMVTKIKASWIFYQVEYLSIIHEIMNNKLFISDPYFVNLKNLFSTIIKDFFELFNSKNKLVMIEALFRFTGPLHKNQILTNYECTEIVEDYEHNANGNKLIDDYVNNREKENGIGEREWGEEENDAVYDGKILFERDIEEIETKKPKKKKEDLLENLELNKWTENEDLILIDNYYEFKDHEDYLVILDKLFPLKTSKDIKNRIKTLKLKKGYEKAMRVLRKVHQKKKEKEENLFNVIIELSDECRDESKKHKIEKTIKLIKEQLKSYKLKRDLLNNSPEIDCVLIPTSNDEIDVFNNKKFMEFIKNIGFVPPSIEDYKRREIIDLTKNEELTKHDKMDIDINENLSKGDDINEVVEIIDLTNNRNEAKEGFNKNENNSDLNRFWKINPLSDVTDIEIMIEKLDNFGKVINENMQINEEYEEIKRENKKNKKEKKKKHKKEKKKKHKKEKKHKKHKNENKNENSENEDYADEDDYRSSRSASIYQNNKDEAGDDDDLNYKNIINNSQTEVNIVNNSNILAKGEYKDIKDNFRKEVFYSDNIPEESKSINTEQSYYEEYKHKEKISSKKQNVNYNLMEIEDHQPNNNEEFDELNFLNNNFSKNKKRLKKGVKGNDMVLNDFE